MRLALATVAAMLAAAGAALPALGASPETVGPQTALTSAGRHLVPAGHMTAVGTFPRGGALTPDGRFYWAVDAGRGVNAVRVVDVRTGALRQTLPIPGGHVGIAFTASGRHAYVSGEPGDDPTAEALRGANGDVIHVFDVDPASGHAVERDPITLPAARDGAAPGDELPPAQGASSWPQGLDVTRDGRYLVVALGQADQAAIVDLRSRSATLADVGRYPYGVATDPHRSRAYVTNERDGTVTALELPSGRTLGTVAVGGRRGAAYAHPEGLAADPRRDRLYVAVSDRDLVAVVDTRRLALERYVNVGRGDAQIGSAPVAASVGPRADTLFVANAGEDAVVAVALEQRPPKDARLHTVYRPRKLAAYKRYR